ncbi:hypothetical protein V8F20_006914 [Naviculisporaceae sp. PSN 640]
MAPHPPNPLAARGINSNNPSISEVEVRKIQEIVDRTFKLSNLQPRQPQNQPVTVTVIANNPATTVIANNPTTTVVTAPPATSSPIDTSDQSVETSSSLNGGAIAGIVIGSIVGLLLLIWIFKSCSNLGAPPTDQPPRDGKAWYDNVRGAAVVEEPRRPYRESRAHRHHHHHGGSRSRSRHHHHSHSHSPHHYRRSAEIREVSQVREVPVAVVRSSSRRGSGRVYEDDGYGYSSRGRSVSRSRSRSRGRSHMSDPGQWPADPLTPYSQPQPPWFPSNTADQISFPLSRLALRPPWLVRSSIFLVSRWSNETNSCHAAVHASWSAASGSFVTTIVEIRGLPEILPVWI